MIKTLKQIFASALIVTLILTSSMAGGAPVKLIIDTDFDTDVDDVAALALAHAYADQGDVDILGVAIAGLCPESAPAVHALNSYFGRSDIPIGIRKGHGVMRNSIYTKLLIDRFPSTFQTGKSPGSVELYRKILSESDPSSVVIVSLGYLTNLADLLASSPDEYSPLGGLKLIEEKVKLYVCMGGAYPRQMKTGKWGNILPDPASAISVNKDWPTPVIYTGGEDFSREIMTGGAFTTELPAGSLLRDSYELFFNKSSWAKGPTHHSADLIAIQVAVKGIDPYFQETKYGYSHIFPDGTMEWRTDRDMPNRSYVAQLAPDIQGSDVARFFDSLLVRADVRSRTQP